MAEGTEVEVVETKKKSRLLLWIILGSLLLVVGVVGTLLLLDYLRPPTAVASGEAPGEAATGGSNGTGGTVERVKSTMNLDPFLVNLADEESTRFVKVTLRLGVDQSGAGEQFADDPVIVAATRDKIISLLTTKTSEQILTAEGKQKLREEIRDLVNPVLPRGKVVEVYIMDFVVQL